MKTNGTKRRSLKGGDADLVVTRKIKKNGVVIKDDLEVRPYAFIPSEDIPHPARVGVTTKLTKSIDRDYISVGITVEVPCAPTEKRIKSTYRKVSAIVADLLNDEMEAAQESLDV